MRRRQFIALIGGAAAASWPVVARAQKSSTATLGIMVLGNPDPMPFMNAFRDGLRAHGYVEGQNILLAFRSAGGNPNLLPAIAAELVALKVDIIVTLQTTATIAAKQATKNIPIVMGAVGDPIGTGLVDSLARPGGNVTGVTGMATELGGKNLDLIREVLPSARRVAVLSSADSFGDLFVEHIQSSARTLAIEIKAIRSLPAEEFDTAFSDMEKWQADAVIVQPSHTHKRAADLALKHRLPTFTPNSDFPKLGGMVAYSADLPALYREGAAYVDKILKGRIPAELPVQLPTKFLLVINLRTAKALGLTVPPQLLARADEVIE